MIYSSTKPPMGTQIDWTDPLSQGLVGCWLFNEGGGSEAFDLCGSVGAKKGAAVINANGLYNSTTSGGVATGKQLPAQTTDTSFTYFCVVKLAVTTTGTVMGNRYEGTSSPLQFIKISQYGASYYNNGSSVDFGPADKRGSKTSMCLTKKGTAFNFYSDGAKVGLTATSSLTNDPNPIYLMTGNLTGNSEVPIGTMYCALVYNRALSAQEIQRLHEMTKEW